ncbi:MAG TPA: hypothetical protein EYP35_11165 [Desulfobacterales bacterium]|nr:hypothetical protein [Desulfobacterales bacterium]HIP39027.1 hypothetical protein [Desulfocapsa sulfexigens]
MLKTLLYINEDLASSIALRFTAYVNKFIPVSLHITHIEEPDENKNIGRGWVQRAWEDGVTSSGKRLIDRMLRTESIDCPLAGRPIVEVGDREREILYTLRNGLYELYVEGYLNTADTDLFYNILSSQLYTEAPCPILVVKNLSISKKCALLCADSVDPKLLVEQSMAVLGDSTFNFDIVFFKFCETGDLRILEKAEGGKNLKTAETALLAAGKNIENVTVLLGTPEQVGDYLKEYAIVTSTLPKRNSMRMHVLANSLASVLLVR